MKRLLFYILMLLFLITTQVYANFWGFGGFGGGGGGGGGGLPSNAWLDTQAVCMDDTIGSCMTDTR